ncbi:hypothetical protein HNR08_003561 [Cellulomonas hominis]|uniref:Uncharacterized protein n=1 Tax=Cellulomonas hominis TaxID=156981 RepID=A0A7W8SIT0_9CELL|nr:hypothetical protein [Cellulomonas hominis]
MDRNVTLTSGSHTPAIVRAYAESNHVQRWFRLPVEATLT